MSILKKLKSLAPALSAVVVAACIGVSLHGYSTPVYAVDIPETTKNQTDEDASEQENADTAEKEKKEDKKKVEGQFDMYNYKLAEIAHELDKVNLNELTPIDALNTLVKIKEKMK